MLGVSNNADNLTPNRLAVLSIYAHPSSNWIFVRPVLTDDRFANYYYQRLVVVVGPSERATLDERNGHRPEIARGYLRPFCVDRRIPVPIGLSFDLERAVVISPKRHRTRRARSFDAWQSLNPFDNVFEE